MGDPRTAFETCSLAVVENVLLLLVVLKSNANQRYATTAVTSLMFKEFARRAGVPVQEFVVRQDCGCGSTIGPITAARVGIRTVDVGNPMLSMHSCREQAGSADVAPMIAVHGPPASLTVVGVSDNTATVPGRRLGHQAALARPLELA